MATKKKLSEEDLKNIKLLQENNKMLEKTKEEAKLRGKKETVDRIAIAQEEVIQHIKEIDADASVLPEDFVQEKDLFSNIIDAHVIDEETTIFDHLNKHEKEEEEKVNKETASNTSMQTYANPHLLETDISDDDTDAAYDIISLPSNGECYKNKLSRVPVGYLTAYDENFLTSPNLYRDGIVIDFLLKQKVLNSKINVDDLVSGDADAITLFLRATSYGVEFPIVVTDPESGKEIETVVDLSTLKSKEFKLVGDENGWFEYELPISKDKIKFRYLTRKDIKNLGTLAQIENDGYKANKLNEVIATLTTYNQVDKILSPTEKQANIDYIEKLKNWQKKLSERDSTPFAKMITNKLEMHIMSVNGNEDRKFIAKYSKKMPAKDALSLRRYITENEPGINFEITIERPKEFGGGSFKTFLEWDDAVFLNIPEL